MITTYTWNPEEESPFVGTWAPGEFVHRNKVTGIVIAVTYGVEIQATVLWTRNPDSLRLPTPRRVFPSLIANQLIQVQPVPLPSGLIFYVDPVVKVV